MEASPGFLKARYVPMLAEEAVRASSKPTRIRRPRWTCEGPEQEQGGEREAYYKPRSGLGHREAYQTHANRHPPVEPALYHCGSPMVAGEGWGTRTHNPAAAAEAGSSPRLRVSPGDPPPVTPPHHGEVTCPWAAVGVNRARKAVMRMIP